MVPSLLNIAFGIAWLLFHCKLYLISTADRYSDILGNCCVVTHTLASGLNTVQ